ncbi:response regulator transcription factor [Ruminococcus sp. YE282]|jgi:DNA-binding response OmpR family regulator|uniref:response regulator transcription factor n=1 Tax=Ruminococcus sp. YE282 TaxID=3158780 RepID=UPI00088184FF|nr:DNA-binding response regulator, OmpR family, contains REC and winged-helix (wHTH) domain [Ruminococcus bromii]HCB94659.1 DNA-binding response regulator [Ruminococcus sp.]
MQILIVEDEKRLADALYQILLEQKYMADVVYNGIDALEYGLSGIYDLIILDIMIPYKDGFEVAYELRKNKIDTPILMLTAKDTVPDKVTGLNKGADDYMTKPFAPEELIARIKALTRRKGEVVLDKTSFDDFNFNASSNTLSKGTKSVHLNYKEAEILKLLLSKPDVIVSKDEIITKVWGYDSDAGSNNVEAYISFLRRKLNFINSDTEIKSIKKMGYRLEKSM